MERTMEEPKELKPFMQACFTEAKEKLRVSERVGLVIGVVAVGAAFIPEDWSLLAWGVAVGSLGLVVWHQWLGYGFREQYGCAEGIRNQYLLSDGLGCKVSPSILAELQVEFSGLEADEEPYYTSHLEPGAKRLWMLVWESAFWSKDLQKHLSAKFRKKFFLSAGFMVAAMCLGLFGPEKVIMLKVLPPAFALVVGLSFGWKWVESKQVQTLCEKTAERCRERVEGGATSPSDEEELCEVMRVVVRYSSTMLTAYPAQDELHKLREEDLNAGWDAVVAGLAGSEWGKVDGGAPKPA